QSRVESLFDRVFNLIRSSSGSQRQKDYVRAPSDCSFDTLGNNLFAPRARFGKALYRHDFSRWGKCSHQSGDLGTMTIPVINISFIRNSARRIHKSIPQDGRKFRTDPGRKYSDSDLSLRREQGARVITGQLLISYPVENSRSGRTFDDFRL